MDAPPARRQRHAPTLACHRVRPGPRGRADRRGWRAHRRLARAETLLDEVGKIVGRSEQQPLRVTLGAHRPLRLAVLQVVREHSPGPSQLGHASVGPPARWRAGTRRRNVVRRRRPIGQARRRRVLRAAPLGPATPACRRCGGDIALDGPVASARCRNGDQRHRQRGRQAPSSRAARGVGRRDNGRCDRGHCPVPAGDVPSRPPARPVGTTHSILRFDARRRSPCARRASGRAAIAVACSSVRSMSCTSLAWARSLVDHVAQVSSPQHRAARALDRLVHHPSSVSVHRIVRVADWEKIGT